MLIHEVFPLPGQKKPGLRHPRTIALMNLMGKAQPNNWELAVIRTQQSVIASAKRGAAFIR